MYISTPSMKTKKAAPNVRRSQSGRIMQKLNGMKPGRKKGADIPIAKKISDGIKVSPVRLMLISLIIGIAGFVYITHVFTTQRLLQETTQIQREYDRVRILYEDRALTYDRMTGPADVYARAKDQGFIESGAGDQVIEVRR